MIEWQNEVPFNPKNAPKAVLNYNTRKLHDSKDFVLKKTYPKIYAVINCGSFWVFLDLNTWQLTVHIAASCVQIATSQQLGP